MADHEESAPAVSRYMAAIRERIRQQHLSNEAWIEMTPEERAAAPGVCLQGHEVPAGYGRGCPQCLRDVQWLLNPFHDIQCGRHSGIPSCCIAFFFVWKRWLHKTAWAETQPKDWGYAPCPRCVRLGRRIAVKKCNCSKSRSAATSG